MFEVSAKVLFTLKKFQTLFADVWRTGWTVDESSDDVSGFAKVRTLRELKMSLVASSNASRSRLLRTRYLLLPLPRTILARRWK